MEVIQAVEKRRPVRETPAQKLARDMAAFFGALTRMTLLALVFAPILLLSFLTIDLPVRGFDQMFDNIALKPGNWLSLGGLFMAGGVFLAILFARRFGGDDASRAVTAAWGLAAVATFAEISYLAPSLEAGDFPSVRFVIAFVSSAMVGQYAAIGVYDITRGGGSWWRAPFLAALTGFALQSFLYFMIAFWTISAPWFFWMVSDLAVKTLLTVGFLGVYWLLQKSLKPTGGYGGR